MSCLSFNRLREYLTLPVENGLIEYESGPIYRTTEKGMRLLHLQNKIDEVAPVSFMSLSRNNTMSSKTRQNAGSTKQAISQLYLFNFVIQPCKLYIMMKYGCIRIGLAA
jgi:Winged helix-turn-helix